MNQMNRIECCGEYTLKRMQVGLPGLGRLWEAEVALPLIAAAAVGVSSVALSHGSDAHGSSTRARFLVRLLRGIAAHAQVMFKECCCCGCLQCGIIPWQPCTQQQHVCTLLGAPAARHRGPCEGE